MTWDDRVGRCGSGVSWSSLDCSTLLGLGGAALWVGSRLSQEPDLVAVQGTPDDGIQAQQKIFDLIRGESRSRSRPRQVVLTEAELNRFLSKHLVEVAKMPDRRPGRSPHRGWSRRIQGALAAPGPPVGIDLHAAREPRSASVAGATSLAPSRRQGQPGSGSDSEPAPLPSIRRSCASRSADSRYRGFSCGSCRTRAFRGSLRWRMPESVEGLTIDPGVVVIKTSS